MLEWAKSDKTTESDANNPLANYRQVTHHNLEFLSIFLRTKVILFMDVI